MGSGREPLNRDGGRQRETPGLWVSQTIARHPRVVLGALVLITFGLGWPMLFWSPEGTASQNPVTEIATAQELVAERFADDVFRYFLLIEANGGDVLGKAPLRALLDNTRTMRDDPDTGGFLIKLRDPTLGIDVDGVWTIADSVDRLLRQVGVDEGLAGATEEQVDDTIAALLGDSNPLEWGLASGSHLDDGGVWHSPALFVTVATDNEMLGGGGFLVTLGTDDLVKEEFARTLSAAIEGNGSELSVWAPAADVNLTSNEQGELAGPFIGMTIAVVLLIVGIAFRSYWAVAVAGAALAMLMVWLRGGANLIGLKSDQLLSTILPISMISFGIDSAFHGIGRVREMRQRGLANRRAFVLGIGSVFGALALAATSDAAAFLSNTAAGIESVVQFGFAAALATGAAFVLLGIATPLSLSMIEGRLGNRSITRFGPKGDMGLSLIAAGMATAAVLFLVFVSAAVGLALLAGYLVVALLLPLFAAGRQPATEAELPMSGSSSRRLGKLVGTVASRPWITVGVATLVTGAALWAALQLEVTFDVKDFFSPESDFVVALDKTAEYLGDQGGEPALVYVETDLTSSGGLVAIEEFTATVAAVDDSPLARDVSGDVNANLGVLALLADMGREPGGSSSTELARAYDDALSAGVEDVQGNTLWTPNAVGTVLWREGSGDSYATVLTYQIPDTRDQANVVETRALLEPAAQDLEDALRANDPDARVVVTGSAVFRDDQLAGVRRAMLLALPIAVIACFGVAGAFMRSFRYALVSIVPILLVVTWLFGIMQRAGYGINVVTAIIGAVSVGIGIDFSTHFTMRFLEERRDGASKGVAVTAAGAGTGSALAGSAFTSVAGFGVLAFAPMPMFATYGLLTATMIVLALAASLLVLPSLLVLVTNGAATEHRATGRVVDLRSGQTPAIRVGLARDLSDGVVDHVLASFEHGLRRGDLMVRTVPGGDVPGLVANGSLDLGLVVRWPGAVQPFGSNMEVLPLAHEELVAVGGVHRVAGESVTVGSLAHGLLVAGPHPESEEGVKRLLAMETPSPVLAHTVADVLTGARLASITGGAMILPRSMADVGSLSVRPLDPPASVETVLLVMPERSADSEIFELVVALNDALTTDPQLSAQTPADT